ncbi:hypothetical protein B0H13DRAFT_2313569 [Mycena leptocephala]|nr:hypothetical protein B0H13DRAFT_2313569 [Mycena leptocephala]
MRIPRGTLAGVVRRVRPRRGQVEPDAGADRRDASHRRRADVWRGVVYYAQTPWIRNATVRENVLFGKPFELDRYRRIMEAVFVA